MFRCGKRGLLVTPARSSLGTDEGFFACVGAFMCDEVLTQREALVTVRAAVGFLLVVRAHVGGEMLRLRE